ncbi:hypothetical protein G6514_007612 [Epicoccum nigrum]|nr:hypothetical protein G6514_007612 [Epicoccum nigrum]
MSTTTTLVEPPVNLEKKAQVFVIAVDDQVPYTDEEKEALAKTFLLNSKDFIDLQKYLIAGGELPGTGEQFEAEYPRASLDKFFKADPGLYDVMKIVLPRIQQNTTRFRIDTLEPMILLGGKIANFSKFAGDYLKMLSNFINKMTEHPVNSPQYNKEKKGAATVLKALKDHAEKVQAECTKTVNELGAFKVLTGQDASDLKSIQERIHKVIPNEDAKNSVIAGLIADAKRLVEAAREQIDAELEKARENGTVRWYHYVPIVGPIMLGVALWRQGKLNDSLKELNDRYMLAKQKSENEIDQIVAADHQITLLFGEIKGVDDTIANAINAVDKMQKTFGELATCFSAILDNLNNVESDSNVEDIQTILVDYNIDEAAKTWKQVAIYAKVFTETGLARDAAKEAPPIPIEGQ